LHLFCPWQLILPHCFADPQLFPSQPLGVSSLLPIPPPHPWNEVWFKTEEETETETKSWQLLFLLLANVFPF